MNRHLTLVVVAILLWVVPASALKRFQQPSRTYTAATRIYDIPPSVDRKYVGVSASFTRENWPGLTTLGVSVTALDTTLIVPLGHGDLHFPTTAAIAGVEAVSGPVRLNITRADGTSERVRLISRVGDALTVQRGLGGTVAPINAGASIRVLGLFRFAFQATRDGGTTWVNIGAAQADGGVILDEMGNPILASTASFSSINPATGERIAEDGDTRVIVTNLVAIRTAITLEMQETTDPARLK